MTAPARFCLAPPARGPLLWLALAALTAACAPTPGPIADLRNIPQEPATLLGRRNPQACLVRPGYQRMRDRDFDRRYFDCWQRRTPRHSREEVLALAQPLLEAPGVGENLEPRPAAWYAGLIANPALSSYPSADWRGITTAPCDLRVLPTLRPDFAAAGRPGAGFPFDRLQQSAVPAGLPLRVWHQSPDGAWLLAETPLALGWLPAPRVARAGPRFRARWQSGRYLAVTRDDTALTHGRGRFLFQAGLGAIYPLLGRGDGHWRVLAPRAAADGQARAVEARLPRTAGAPKPLPLTPGNLARLAGRLLGQPYGWGGLFGNRDCSALTRNLLVPFGLWLPRNSADQARRGGRFVDLAGLPDLDKTALIKAQAVPYLTLLWMPGHVMLYLGSPRGRPLVLHSIWGLKTAGPWCGEGRRIIGRTVITSLTPGAELPELARPQGLLLHRLAGMALLVPPAALCPRAGAR